MCAVMSMNGDKASRGIVTDLVVSFYRCVLRAL